MDVTPYWTILFLGILLPHIEGFVLDGLVSPAEYGNPLWSSLGSQSPIDWYVTNNQSYIVFAAYSQTLSSDGTIAIALNMNPNPVTDPPPEDATTIYADYVGVFNFPFRANIFFLTRSGNLSILYAYYENSSWTNSICSQCFVKFGNSADQVEFAVPWTIFSNLYGVNGLQFWGKYIQGANALNSGDQEHGLALYNTGVVDTSSQFYYDTFPYVRYTNGTWFDVGGWAIGQVPVNTTTEYTQSDVIFAPNLTLILDDQVHVTSLILNIYTSFTLSPNSLLIVGSKNGNTTSILYVPQTSLMDASQSSLTIGGPALLGSTAVAGNVTVANLTLTSFGNQLCSISGNLPLSVINEVLVGKSLLQTTVNITYKSSAWLRYLTGISATANNEWSDDDENSSTIPPYVVIDQFSTVAKLATTGGVLSRGNMDIHGSLTVSCSGVTSLRVWGAVFIDGSLSLNCPLVAEGVITVFETGTVSCQYYSVMMNGDTPLFQPSGVQWFNGSQDSAPTSSLTSGSIIAVGNDGVTVQFPDNYNVSSWMIDDRLIGCLGLSSCFFAVGDLFGASILVNLYIGPNQDCPATFKFNLTDVTTDRDPNNTNAGIGGGAIAGIVIAILVASVVGAAGTFFFLRKRMLKKNYDSDSEIDLGEVRSSVASVSSITSASGITRTLNARRTLRDEWEIPYSQLTLGKELGRGAFGIVYKCRWRNTDCVVKQLDINKNDQQSIDQFLREANHVQNLRSHPNVCTVFGVCTNPEFPICIVMEYVPEGSLDILVYQRKILPDAKMVLELAKDIASGMSHLHTENVLHCDLACRNLLVISRGNNKYQVKIADFGLSRVTETDTYNASNTRTFPVRWTAPETLQSGKISRASDVWSFGVVLWEIMEGKRPYPDMSNAEIIKAVCDNGYRLPKPERIPIPDQLYDIVVECWKEDPQQRPTFDSICKRIDLLLKRFFQEEDEGGTILPVKKEDDTYNNDANANANYNTGVTTKTVELPDTNYN